MLMVVFGESDENNATDILKAIFMSVVGVFRLQNGCKFGQFATLEQIICILPNDSSGKCQFLQSIYLFPSSSSKMSEII